MLDGFGNMAIEKKAACGNTLITPRVGLHDFLDRPRRMAVAFLVPLAAYRIPMHMSH